MKVQIEKLVYGGEGLAHSEEGSALLVPFTLPGEIVQVESIAGSIRIVELIEPSADRVLPRCVHFGACGGCQYQHIHADAQITVKAEILQNIFKAAGLAGVPKPQLHAAEPWHYRNRIRLRLGVVDGSLRFGYNRRGSYDLLPIVECPIAAPLLLRACRGAAQKRSGGSS